MKKIRLTRSQAVNKVASTAITAENSTLVALLEAIFNGSDVFVEEDGTFTVYDESQS